MSEFTPRVRVPAQVEADTPFEVRTLINHPMETGQRTGSDGNRVPRRIINRFVATVDGETVVDLDIDPAISPNPQFVFSARLRESAVMEFEWHDDSGDIYRDSAEISVT